VQGLNALVEAINWFVLLVVPVGVVAGAVSVRRHQGLPARRRRRVVALDVGIALVLLAVLAITLLRVPDSPTGWERGLQLRPLSSIRQALTSSVDASVPIRIVGLNILLFVPLGLLLASRLRSWRLAVVACACTSVAIEVLQAVLPLGRITNIDDVILNTTGAALGATLWWWVRQRRGRGAPWPLVPSPRGVATMTTMKADHTARADAGQRRPSRRAQRERSTANRSSSIGMSTASMVMSWPQPARVPPMCSLATHTPVCTSSRTRCASVKTKSGSTPRRSIPPSSGSSPSRSEQHWQRGM
jgi:glycopeptide antibiotics resistance protein